MCPLEFIARRQPALATGAQDAVGMRVAPARMVALGKHEHVVAERRQQFATQRAVIRGWLAVLRPTYFPPARTLFCGHRLVMLDAMAAPHAEELEGLSRSEILRASPTMFDTRWLDKLSRVHPSVPLIIFVPAIAVLLVEGFVHGAGAWTPAWLLGGYLFWTLTEYWLHRIVFHFEPEDGIGARLHWIIHGVHHDHPNDPMRLVMPPSVSVPLAAIFIFVFSLVLGSPAFLPFGAGFLAGYLFYDMLHYHVHHHTPTTALGKRLRELHMRHHFQNHERGYGVSAPFWDHVFGTAPKQ
jgi:sterol desaturase/sphingolipid hydroxylase (fatty acid hydroxylase superfamily)